LISVVVDPVTIAQWCDRVGSALFSFAEELCPPMTTHNDSLVNALSELGLSTVTDPVPEMPEDGFIAQWPNQRVVRLTGPDARKFLQGQLTCQLDQLDTTHSLLASACTPKGRALATFRLVALESPDDGSSDSAEILLRLSADLEQTMLGHFQKYLAFFKAQMTTAEDWCLVGLTGDGALRSLGIDWNGAPGDVLPWNRSLLVATQPDAYGRRRVELWLNSADRGHFEACLQAGDTRRLASQAAWLAGEIQGGLTTINEQLRDRYVPQYFNWHAVDGISFRKGCYTGQEIIARMRYLGQLKKSTYRVLLPRGGAGVLAVIADATGRAVGEITNLVSYGSGNQEALAIINHTATGSSLQLADASDRPVLLGALPYAVPEQETPSEK
jgi:folate-binding protein YgfZ